MAGKRNNLEELKDSFNAVNIRLYSIGKNLQCEAWFEFAFEAEVYKEHILECKACREDQVYCFTYDGLHAVFFQA